MKYAFPVNGVERNCCERCLFYDGSFDRELRYTDCGFPVGAPMGATFMMPYSAYEESLNPELKKKRLEPCPCFIDRKNLRKSCRAQILKGLKNKEKEP